MKIKVQAGAVGHFRNVEVLDKNGAVKFQTGEFPNLITDQGLSRLYSTAVGDYEVFSYMKASSDSSSPQEQDTTLPGLLGSVRDTGDGVLSRNVAEGYVSKTFTWTFPVGAVVGNVSKLATGWQGSNTGNFSIALIRDTQGNPTSITVLADEQLRVTWELRLYWPTEDVIGTLVNEGNRGGSFNYTVRASLVSGGSLEPWAIGDRRRSNLHIGGDVGTSSQGHFTSIYYGETTLGPITGVPSSVGENVAQGAYSSLTSSSPSARGTFRLAPAQGNSPLGIGGMRFGTGAQSFRKIGCHFQVKFDPPIPKTALDVLEIDVQASVYRHVE